MRGSNGGPPTSRRKVCRTVAVIGFVHLARCFLVAMAEAEFHVVKPVSCQQNWGIPGWHSYLQCCYDFPRRCSDRQGTSRDEIFCIGIRMMSESVLIENCANFKVRDRIQAVLCAKNQAHQNSSTDEIDDFWNRWNLAFWWHVLSKTAVSGISPNRWKRWNRWNLISP